MDIKLNIKELENRGYKKSVNNFLNEGQWIKGDIIISIHSVRGCCLQYLQALLDEKEKFKFEILNE